MSSRKRGALSRKKKRTCSDGASLISDIWSQLHEDVASNLRRSVVSLVLTNEFGDPHEFSGMAIECQSNFTKFVTTGNLAEYLQSGHLREVIKVYFEGNVFRGYLEEVDSDCQVAVVKVMCALNVYCVHLNPAMECTPCRSLIAVGCSFHTIIATSGKRCESKDRDFLIFSQVNENWLGAAFFDIDGNFVGMNHSDFLPCKIFLERSKSRGVFRYVGINGWYETPMARLSFHPKAYDVVDKEQFPDLISLGYPIPSRSMVNRGMILVHTYEDPFGDLYPNGVWDEFRKRISSEISRNVVALASFRGETRFFACTGVFIDYDDKYPKILTSASLIRDPDGRNKVVEDLRIEVLLPSKQRKTGILKHYSLHYNVAVVSVEYRALCPLNLERCPVKLNDYMKNDSTVVAVGRIFQSGTLMAASGKLTADTGMLNCEVTCYSTCKITKAGIGGPLVDIDGNFIGMNFHGMYCKEIGTPFLYHEDLCRILEFLKTKEPKRFVFGGKVFGDEEPIRIQQGLGWSVPKPYWCDESDIEEEDMNDKRELVPNGCPVRYILGSITVLK